jgi:hypothetical protein
MSEDRDAPVARPTQDQELYLYTDEDVSRACTELYLQLIQAGLSQSDAAALADFMFDLFTGAWMTDA